MRFERSAARVLSALVIPVACACAEPPGRWSGTEWWESYASLPEVALTPVSAGALDQTTQPFPAVRSISVSEGGRIAVVQEGIPSVWAYDPRGRSLGKAGRSEIMDARGPGRTRVWARRAGWLAGERLWVAERGGSIAVFNDALAFSDVWEPSVTGDPVAVVRRNGALSAVVQTRGDSGSVLRSVARSGAVREIAAAAPGDTLVSCPDASCFVSLSESADGPGYSVILHSVDGPGESRSFAVPPAPEAGAEEGEDAPRPVRDLIVDEEHRVWVGLALDGSDRAYWLVLDPEGTPVGRFHLTDGQRAILVDRGVLWVRRGGDGVTWLHRYEVGLPRPGGVPPESNR